MIVPGYGAEKIDFDETLKWIEEYGAPLMQHVCDAGELLENAVNAGKSVLFEAQLGALRDIDYGIYPFTSSSSPLAAYAPVGCGLPSLKVDRVVGVTKAYSTCVGEGPFVGELDGEEGRQAARSRRGIRRRHRTPAPRGLDGSGGHPLRHGFARRDRAGADQAGRFELP